METTWIERAKARLAARADAAATDAALERARAGVEALAETVAELEAGLPGRVEAAVREGMRTEALPVARQLAEVRGLAAQTIRRLERLEADLLAERNARVDDLALLVELVASGWHAVDERLARVEGLLADGERRPLDRVA
jgi:hypothetical protein